MAEVLGSPKAKEFTLPTNKVAAGGAAGALSVLIVFVIGQAGVDLPPEVSSSLTVLISFVAGYFKKA